MKTFIVKFDNNSSQTFEADSYSFEERRGIVGFYEKNDIGGSYRVAQCRLDRVLSVEEVAESGE